MRLTALLATLTFLTLAFAGCSDGGGEGDGETASSTSTSQASTASASTSSSATKSSTTTSSSSSTGTGAPANAPPTGSVSASVNGTNATFTLTGTDPDGDALTWELDLGDGTTEDGTTLPATVNHTYAAGNYTANFTITDGTAPVTYDVDIAAVSGTATATRQVVDASYPIANTGCADPPPMAVFGTPLGGTIWAEWAVDAATIGQPFKVDVASLSPVGTIFGLAFYDADGAAIAGSGGVGTNTLTGVVADGAVNGLVTDCGGIATVTVHYEAGPGVV